MRAVLPRLGIYVPGAGSGGPWRYVHAILAAIDLSEFEVIVFSDLPGVYPPRPEVRVAPLGESAAATRGAVPDSSPPGGKWPTRSASRDVPSGKRRLVPTLPRVWAGFGRAAGHLAGLFRRWRLDLLHTNNTGCEESPLAARLAGIPRVLGTFHVDSTYDLEGRRSGWTHRALEHLSNHCLGRAIGVSQATSRDWIARTHLSPGRVITIPNGINLDRFGRRASQATARAALGLPAEGRLILGGVGRLEQAKGFSFLLEAVAQLAVAFPGLLVALAGQGPLQGALAAQAARLGIADRVRFLGFCPDVQVVYDALDVFVLPSLCEALPFALLEAMATSLPAVASAVGGVPEVIVPGQTGFLVPPRDGPALAAALRPLLTRADLRLRLGQAGRERVARHFREDDMVRRTIQVYRDLLRTRRAVRTP